MIVMGLCLIGTANGDVVVAKAPVVRQAPRLLMYRAVPKIEVNAAPSAPVKVEAGTAAYSRRSLLGRSIVIGENPTVTVHENPYETSTYKLQRGILGIPRWRSVF